MLVGRDHQRGKNVVSASSGNTTSSAPAAGGLAQHRDQPLDHLARGCRSRATGPHLARPPTVQRSRLTSPRARGRVGAGEHDLRAARWRRPRGRRRSVCSAGLWLMPADARARRSSRPGTPAASIWASWPAPDGMRRVERPEPARGRLDEVDHRRVERRPARSGPATSASIVDALGVGQLVAELAPAAARPRAARPRRCCAGRR